VNVKLAHVLAALAVGVLTLGTLLLVGCGATSEPKTIATVAAGLPNEAARQAAAANVRTATVALEAFYAEHGTYDGADVAALRRNYDPAIDPTVKLGWVASGRYCVESTVAGQTASMTGPGGTLEFGGC
jgi:hypothetical protein